MAHRDYRKEVGLPSPKKTVPRPVAIVVMALVAVVVTFGVVRVVDASEKHHNAGKAGSAAPAD